jgi:hypothetical protein
MSRTKTPLLALFFISVAAGWIASCGTDTSRFCTPNTTLLCTCPGRFEGVQTCSASGSEYGTCDCSGPLRQGEGGAPNAGLLSALVGRSCTESSQCGAGLTCLTSTSNDFFGAGPANGYCTAGCTADAECASIDPQAVCVGADATQAGGGGLCARTCLSQDPRTALENKCLGRRDVVCQSEAYLGSAAFTGNRQDGLCLPQCGSDEDCGTRRCDLARGLCTDTVATGAAIGAACTQNSDCAGNACVQIGGQTFCSAPCVFGQPVGCGSGVSSPSIEAACLRPRVTGLTGSEGRGDIGFCIELCSQTSDCEQGAGGKFECDPSDEIQRRYHRTGACDVIPPAADAGADTGADAAPALDASASDAG